MPRREAQLFLERAASDMAPLVARAPDAITMHASVQSREVILRFEDYRSRVGTMAAFFSTCMAYGNNRICGLNFR